MPTTSLMELADAELALEVSRSLSSPRTADNSFTLHAPLELLARLAMLPRVEPAGREMARRRMVSLATNYESQGEPIPLPDGPAFASAETALDALLAAMAEGDADTADRAMVHLVETMPVPELCALLAPPTTTMMTAAGHAPILLANWPAASARLDGRMVRHLARQLCVAAGITAELPDPNAARDAGSLEELDAALRDIVRAGEPGWGIFLVVHQAEQRGVMGRLPAVAADRIDDAFAVACRVAAASMLLDNPEHAPYHWSHALTLPMGLWGAHRHHADPIEALDVALTHVAAFRAGFGAHPVGHYAPDDPGVALAEAVDRGPTVAGAAAFHDPRPDEAVITTLATVASAEHDAHLVKYLHACTQAAELDPAHRRLYLAAAASLAGWWRENPPDDDPLA